MKSLQLKEGNTDMSIRQTFTDIANAIREKTGSTGLLYPSEMAQNILDIPQGGGEDNLPAFIDGTANFNDYYSSIRNVSAIRPYAFMSDTTVINANFPKVENMGEYAFGYCTNLQTANFPKCSQLGVNVFNHCSNLTEAILPECQEVPSRAFYYCNSLTTAYFPKATYLFEEAFSNCYRLTSIEAPLLKSVGYYAFCNCSKLSEVNFPLLKRIGATWACSTFASTGLKSAYFPLVSYIGRYAFDNCKSLTTANLANAYDIGSAIFRDCTSLETVTLGAYSYSSIAYPSTLFSGCTNLKSIYVPSGALNYYQTSSWWSYWSDKIVPYDESDEYIYPYEYANNTEITEIPLNKQNARYLGYGAFLGCTNLKSVNLPNCEVTYSSQFNSVMKSLPIEYINIGVSYLPRGEYFMQFSKLREFYAPNLREVPLDRMFASCSNLEIAYLPNMVSMIGQATFSNCTNLRSVNLDSVLKIPEATFYGVASLNVINLPACRTFAQGAFQYCYGLKTVSAPNLESWGSSAFQACPLESVYIGSNVTYVGADCVPPGGSTKIYVPNDMVDTYKNGLFSSYSSMIYGY